ncbi:c-type cytochrome [bacterium]|nr:c-type cytochrome [bacterium]
MKKALRYLGIGFVSLIALFILALFVLMVRGSSVISEAPPVSHSGPDALQDSMLVARGQILVQTTSGCQRCHGQNLAGQQMGEPDAFGLFVASNLTAGLGGVGSILDDAGWEKAIRHGIGADGRVLVGMPSEYFHAYSDEDLAALIAYLKQLPPVDNELPKTQPGWLAKVFLGVGLYTPPAVALDPEAPHAAATPDHGSLDYGSYLVSVAACSECHGAQLKGPEFEGPPPGPDLTRTGNLGAWMESDFIHAIRTGSTPDERILDPNMMPWPYFSQMNDSQLSAIWSYLSSLE